MGYCRNLLRAARSTETILLCCRETPPSPHNEDSGWGHPWHLWAWTEAVQSLGPSLKGPGSHGLLSAILVLADVKGRPP